MKPIKYRVHFCGAFVDYTQRARARGFLMTIRAKDPEARIEPIFD